VGRNLSYTASLFYQVSGFMSHFKVLGGDDDLFVYQAADSQNTNICLDPDAFTYSQPKDSRKSWWHQKRRHINTASHYKSGHKARLGIFWLSQIGFLIAAVVAFAFAKAIWITLGIVLFRYLVLYLVVGRAMLKLSGESYELSLKWLIPLIAPLEILLTASQLVLGLANKFKHPTDW
jgi:hypothetical protein